MRVDSFSDSSEDVLNELDPLSRALLDLSVQRGMDDAEIAQVLGTDEASVFEVRVGLLRSLAERVAPEQADAELPELEAAVVAQLYPDETAELEAEPEAEAEPQEDTPLEADDLGDEVDEAELDATPIEPEAHEEPELEPEPRDQPQARKRRSPLVVLLPLLLLITIAALIIALTNGDDDKTSDEPAAQEQPQQQPDRPAPDEPAEPRAVPLTPLGSGNAKGSASISDDKLKLRASGLPDAQGGVYTVWLYDSIIDAKRLTDMRGRTATATLPRDARGYEFLDVSLEPRDGNANHSGQSVLRIELKELR
jgi:hypothetical protein